MVRASIKLDTRSYSKKNDGHPIKVQVSNLGQKYINLYKYSKAEHWNNGVLPSHPDYRTLKQFLNQREIDLMNEVEYCNKHNLNLEDSVKIITDGLESNIDLQIATLETELRRLKKQTGVGLLEFFDIRIAEFEALNKNPNAYKSARSLFSQYLIDQDINMNAITYDFINDFKNWRYKEGSGSQGIRAHLKTFSALYNEAKKRKKYNLNEENPAKGAIPAKQRLKEIYVPSRDEFKKFSTIDRKDFISDVHYLAYVEKVDIFKFQFYIGGQDFADIATLRWSNIKNGRIVFKRYKNRNKPGGSSTIDNIIIDKAWSIIEKYGNKKTDRIFSFIPDPNKDVDAYDVKRNSFYQGYQRRSKMTTKTPRFMFRTYGEKLGYSALTLEVLMGHKPRGQTFDYQGKKENEVLDEALKKIIGTTS